MREVVLDSWPVVVLLKGQEPAAERVWQLFQASGRGEFGLAMSILNLGEVFYLAVKHKNLAYGEEVVQHLRDRVRTIPAPDQLVMLAAALKASYPIAYADAFAAATALSLDIPLVTGDPELQAMSIKEPRLKLEWIA